MKHSERIILKTIDGQVVVRPLADEHINYFVEFEDSIWTLSDEGIVAWNSGLDMMYSNYFKFGMHKSCLSIDFK